MRIQCWDDLFKTIQDMSPSDRQEPVRIVVDDKPIVIAKAVEIADDFYYRPVDEKQPSIGCPKYELDFNVRKAVEIGSWERTMTKGDIYLHAY